MSDNFDLKKYLIENKVTTNSKMLSENETGKFYAPTYLKQKYGEATAKKIEAEIDELDANSWDRFTAMESAEEVEDYIVDIKDMLGLSEMKKKHSKMMKEASDSDREAIENWYHRTNFYIDDLSPEEIEKGIQDHYEEWTAVKDQYSSIEDYFADVERNSDWY